MSLIGNFIQENNGEDSDRTLKLDKELHLFKVNFSQYKEEQTKKYDESLTLLQKHAYTTTAILEKLGKDVDSLNRNSKVSDINYRENQVIFSLNIAK